MDKEAILILSSKTGVIELYGEYYDRVNINVDSALRVECKESDYIKGVPLEDFLIEVFDKNKDSGNSGELDTYAIDTLDLNPEFYQAMNIEYIKQNVHNNEHMTHLILDNLIIERG